MNDFGVPTRTLTAEKAMEYLNRKFDKIKNDLKYELSIQFNMTEDELKEASRFDPRNIYEINKEFTYKFLFKNIQVEFFLTMDNNEPATLIAGIYSDYPKIWNNIKYSINDNMKYIIREIVDEFNKSITNAKTERQDREKFVLEIFMEDVTEWALRDRASLYVWLKSVLKLESLTDQELKDEYSSYWE